MLFLVSGAAHYVTGTVLVVDGGAWMGGLTDAIAAAMDAPEPKSSDSPATSSSSSSLPGSTSTAGTVTGTGTGSRLDSPLLRAVL